MDKDNLMTKLIAVFKQDPEGLGLRIEAVLQSLSELRPQKPGCRTTEHLSALVQHLATTNLTNS